MRRNGRTTITRSLLATSAVMAMKMAFAPGEAGGAEGMEQACVPLGVVRTHSSRGKPDCWSIPGPTCRWHASMEG